MAKVKSKDILVMMKSLITKHCFPIVRPRIAEKLEMLYFDPFVQKVVVYREVKKIRSVREPKASKV